MGKTKRKRDRKDEKGRRPGAKAKRRPGGKTPAGANGIQYVSPSYLEIKCERCGSPNTKATGTKGPIQRRVCLSPTCRHPFKVARRRILAEDR